MKASNDLVRLSGDMTLQNVADGFHLSVDEVIQVLNENCPWKAYSNWVRDFLSKDCSFEDSVFEESCDEGDVL